LSRHIVGTTIALAGSDREMSQAQPSASRQARILVVDDHPLVRAGFKALIDSEPDLLVCAEAATCAQALALAEQAAPDLAVVDLSLLEGSGLDLIKRMHARFPGVRLLVCSMHDESVFAERTLKAGARGYIGKQEATDHVVEAIRKVLSGEVYLSPAMTQRMLIGLADGQPASPRDLTDRELEVLTLIGRGLGTGQVAEQLHLSVKTVENHREKIKRKLKLASAGELARYAIQWALGRSDDGRSRIGD
jgi:DNA-binding NarL/FixJ family response regulator